MTSRTRLAQTLRPFSIDASFATRCSRFTIGQYESVARVSGQLRLARSDPMADAIVAVHCRMCRSVTPTGAWSDRATASQNSTVFLAPRGSVSAWWILFCARSPRRFRLDPGVDRTASRLSLASVSAARSRSRSGITAWKQNSRGRRRPVKAASRRSRGAQREPGRACGGPARSRQAVMMPCCFRRCESAEEEAGPSGPIGFRRVRDRRRARRYAHGEPSTLAPPRQTSVWRSFHPGAAVLGMQPTFYVYFGPVMPRG
jgi:hypothetical protein